MGNLVHGRPFGGHRHAGVIPLTFGPMRLFQLLRRQSWEIPRTSISGSRLDRVRLRVLIFGRFGMEAVHIDVVDSSPHVLVPKAGVAQQAVSVAPAARPDRRVTHSTGVLESGGNLRNRVTTSGGTRPQILYQ
jgi:hypothetical protein